MRFREIHDDPEIHIEDLPYEETYEYQDHELRSAMRYLELYIQYLDSPEKEDKVKAMFSTEKIESAIEYIEGYGGSDLECINAGRLALKVKDILAKQRSEVRQTMKAHQFKKESGNNKRNSFIENIRSESQTQSLSSSRITEEASKLAKTEPISEPSSKQEETQRNLPSWDLANWGIAKEQVNKSTKTSSSLDIGQELEKVNGLKTKNIIRVRDNKIIQDILNQNEGYERYSSGELAIEYPTFVVEQEDLEKGNSLYNIYIMRRRGTLKQMNLPIVEEGERDILADARRQYSIKELLNDKKNDRAPNYRVLRN